MENIKLNQRTSPFHGRVNITGYKPEPVLSRIAGEKAFTEILYSEGIDSFIEYIEWLGFKNDPNMVVLSSKHHFYYDSSELKGVTTITNLKELNEMKHIQHFLHSVRNILHRKGNFIGYFSNNDLQIDYKEGLTKISLLNLFYKLIDFGINKNMTKKSVRQLLEQHGFKVLNMTDINGRTYFHARIV
jgi:hypothetical protein